MNKRIEVPIILVAFSASLNVLFVLGLVIGLITGNGALSLVRPTLMATATQPAAPQPGGQAATIVPTATTVVPTATTRPPTATPVPCRSGEVPGVDCPIVVGGLAVIVVSQTRSKTYFNNNTGIEKGPRDESYEVLIIRLRLPAGTAPSDLNVWFEDGGTHAPMIVDKAGNIFPIGDAWSEEEGDLNVVLVFAIPKDIRGLTLIIQPGDEVDLSLVPDITVREEVTQPATSQPGGQATETSETP